MQFLLDNLSSLLIGGVVFMIMLVTQMGAFGLNVEETAMYASRKQMSVFTSWLEQDLTLIGQNLRTETSRLDAPIQRSDSSLTAAEQSTALFQFSRDTLRTNDVGTLDTIRVFTRYRLVNVNTATIGEDSTVQVFGLTRGTQGQQVANGQAALDEDEWLEQGGSPSTLTFFRIEMYGANGRPTTASADAEFIRVRFSILPPHENPARELRELHWGTTVGLRPF